MRILIIEGNKLFRSILTEQFSGQGLAFELCDAGCTALQLAAEESFDLVCVSYYLEDMKATDFIQSLRQLSAYRYTPVILFTAQHDETLQTNALKVGATEVFLREDLEELIVFIKRYKARYERLRGKVLYIEDSLAQQNSTRLILESVGLQVVCATSAEAGWQCFLDSAFDLLMVDVVLTGDMSGVRFVNNVRRYCGEKGDTPILAISAYDEPSRRIELLNRGANDYVSKPVVQDELIARIRGLIGQKRLMEKLREEYLFSLKRAEFIDSTTDLPNRRMLLQLLEQEIARARKNRCVSALLYIDLHNFKGINDSLGHVTGDGLLREVSQRISRLKQQEDSVASLGGDNFVLVLSEVSSDWQKVADYCRDMADQVQQAIAKPFTVNGHTLHTKAVIGVSLFPEPNLCSHDVLRQAETAFQQARKMETGQVSFFSIEMQRRVEQRYTLLTALRRAIEKNTITLNYQPVFNASRQIVCLEALARWHHKGEPVSPELFIGLAEESGLIHPLGKNLLLQACEHIKVLLKLPLPAAFKSIAINMSPHQLGRAQSGEQLIRLLEEAAVPPSWIKIEITENALISDVDHARSQLSLLREAGIQVAIDDFGIGYSSLAYLRNLAVDQLKIDRSFIWAMLESAENTALVDTVLSIGRALGMSVVAEGVETQAQFDALVERGCDQFQGFLLQRPMTWEATIAEFQQLCRAAPRTG